LQHIVQGQAANSQAEIPGLIDVSISDGFLLKLQACFSVVCQQTACNTRD